MRIHKYYYLLITSITMLMGMQGANASLPIEQNYTHQIPVDFYIVEGANLTTDDLLKEFKIAQDSYNSCGFEVLIQNIYKVSNSKLLDKHDQEYEMPAFSFLDVSFNTSILKEKINHQTTKEETVFQNPNDLLHWESLLFNDYKFSHWEKSFFINTPENSFGALYLDSIDWNVGDSGISGLGYADFVNKSFDKDFSQENRDFYNRHVKGNALITKYKRKHTLAHEMGHAYFNLRHKNDPNNIMMRSRRKYDNQVSEEQCNIAREYLGNKQNYPQNYTCKNYKVDADEQPDSTIQTVKICYEGKKAVDIVINETYVEKEFILRSNHGTNYFDSRDFYINTDDNSDMAMIYLNKTEQGYFLEEVL
ncbi:hypothetical protein N9W41_00925 [bacterium]|nr:hypothetical protein [bacterium]